MSIENKHECIFCLKTFKTKNTLEYHKQTAKFCLKKQGIINTTFKCNYCDKVLATQLRLTTHLNICKTKLKDDIRNEKCEEKEKDILILKLKVELKQKDDYICKLEESLEKANKTIADIAMQPKTTNTTDNHIHNETYITNKFDINDIEKISSVLENHLTTDVLRRGQEGVADMLKTYLLQTEKGEPIYECTDVARQKFEFRNIDGNIETDPNATKLIRNLGRSGMWVKAHTTGKKIWEKEDGTVNHEAQEVFLPNVMEVLEIDKDSKKLRKRLASITAKQKQNTKKV